MTKTVPNKPQEISDSQWLLTWQGSSRTDIVTAVVDGKACRINPFDRGSDAAVFCRPDMQSSGTLLDLSRVPRGVESIEFTLDVMAEGARSWTFEGLGTGEVWQNDSVKVPADAPCLIMSLERQADTWAVVAREKILGEQGDITVDEQIPEKFRELVAKSSARGLTENSIHFSALVDITPTMGEEHEDGSVEKVLTCLVAIAGSANNRPLQVNLQGVQTLGMSVDDDVPRLYSQAILDIAGRAQEAKPLHTLVPDIAESAKPSTLIFVISDAMFFVDDDLIEELKNRDVRIRVLIIGKGTSSLGLPTNDWVSLKVLGNISQLDIKSVMDRLSQ